MRGQPWLLEILASAEERNVSWNGATDSDDDDDNDDDNKDHGHAKTPKCCPKLPLRHPGCLQWYQIPQTKGGTTEWGSYLASIELPLRPRISCRSLLA